MSRKALTLVLACALAAGANKNARAGLVTLKQTGTQSTHFLFFTGALPLPAGAVKNYTASAQSSAYADNIPGPNAANVVNGLKLTYTSSGFIPPTLLYPFPTPVGVFTPRTTTASDASASARAGASGATSITGYSLPGAQPLVGGGLARVRHSARLTARNGGTAEYLGDAWDPFDAIPIAGGPLPAGSMASGSLVLNGRRMALPLNDPDTSWSFEYTGYIKDAATPNSAKFFACDPMPFYTLTASGGLGGVVVDFTALNTPGFSAAFGAGESAIESAVASFLTSPTPGPFEAFQYTMDVSGHYEVSIGLHSAFDATYTSDAPHPTPLPGAGVLALVGLGGLASVRRRLAQK